MVYLPEGEDILIRTKNCHPVSHAGLLGRGGGGGDDLGDFGLVITKCTIRWSTVNLIAMVNQKHSLGGFLV